MVGAVAHVDARIGAQRRERRIRRDGRVALPPHFCRGLGMRRRNRKQIPSQHRRISVGFQTSGGGVEVDRVS